MINYNKYTTFPYLESEGILHVHFQEVLLKTNTCL